MQRHHKFREESGRVESEGLIGLKQLVIDGLASAFLNGADSVSEYKSSLIGFFTDDEQLEIYYAAGRIAYPGDADD